MSGFNRVVATLLWILLLVVVLALAISPIGTLAQAHLWLTQGIDALRAWRTSSTTNFFIAQIAVGVGTTILFAMLVWFEIATARRRGVRIYTAEGGSAELETNSIGRRLAWHLDQLAEVVTVVPAVRSRGSAVDIRLEIEAAPDVDIPLKTEEVVQVTREVIEQELGLRMGRLDVHMRTVPFAEDWVG